VVARQLRSVEQQCNQDAPLHTHPSSLLPPHTPHTPTLPHTQLHRLEGSCPPHHRPSAALCAVRARRGAAAAGGPAGGGGGAEAGSQGRSKWCGVLDLRGLAAAATAGAAFPAAAAAALVRCCIAPSSMSTIHNFHRHRPPSPSRRPVLPAPPPTNTTPTNQQQARPARRPSRARCGGCWTGCSPRVSSARGRWRGGSSRAGGPPTGTSWSLGWWGSCQRGW